MISKAKAKNFDGIYEISGFEFSKLDQLVMTGTICRGMPEYYDEIPLPEDYDPKDKYSFQYNLTSGLFYMQDSDGREVPHSPFYEGAESLVAFGNELAFDSVWFGYSPADGRIDMRNNPVKSEKVRTFVPLLGTVTADVKPYDGATIEPQYITRTGLKKFIPPALQNNKYLLAAVLKPEDLEPYSRIHDPDFRMNGCAGETKIKNGWAHGLVAEGTAVNANIGKVGFVFDAGTDELSLTDAAGKNVESSLSVQNSILAAIRDYDGFQRVYPLKPNEFTEIPSYTPGKMTSGYMPARTYTVKINGHEIDAIPAAYGGVAETICRGISTDYGKMWVPKYISGQVHDMLKPERMRNGKILEQRGEPEIKDGHARFSLVAGDDIKSLIKVDYDFARSSVELTHVDGALGLEVDYNAMQDFMHDFEDLHRDALVHSNIEYAVALAMDGIGDEETLAAAVKRGIEIPSTCNKRINAAVDAAVDKACAGAAKEAMGYIENTDLPPGAHRTFAVRTLSSAVDSINKNMDKEVSRAKRQNRGDVEP